MVMSRVVIRRGNDEGFAGVGNSDNIFLIGLIPTVKQSIPKYMLIPTIMHLVAIIMGVIPKK